MQPDIKQDEIAKAVVQNTKKLGNIDDSCFSPQENVQGFRGGLEMMENQSHMMQGGLFQNNTRRGLMPDTSSNIENFQGGHMMNYHNGITTEMLNNNVRETYGPITLSNGAIYTGDLLNGMKDGYGQ